MPAQKKKRKYTITAAVKKNGAKKGISRNQGRKAAITGEINLNVMKRLVEDFATQEEIAGHFGISQEAISQRISKDPEFAFLWNKAKADGKISFRRRMVNMAKHDGRVAIHLSKQHAFLGYQDKVDIQNNETVNVTHTLEAGQTVLEWLRFLRSVRPSDVGEQRALVLRNSA